MSRWLAGALVGALVAALCMAGACVVLGGGVHVIDEADGVAIITEELAAAGLAATETDEPVAGVVVCLNGANVCEPPISFVLDGWDPARQFGFEYVSGGDPDFPVEPDYTQREAAEALQRAVDDLAGAERTIIVLREVAHQTAATARDQLRGRVRQALSALGL